MNFAMLSDAKGCTVGWGDFKKTPQALKNAFYINDFELSDITPWFQFENTKQLSLNEALDLLEMGAVLPFMSDLYLPDYEQFRLDYEEAQSAFEEGFFKKVLLGATEWAAFTAKQSPLKLLELGVEEKLQEGMYFYAYSLDGHGAWGLSPELLFKKQSDSIKTMALAGTFAQTVENRHAPEHSEVVEFFRELAAKHKMTMSLGAQQTLPYGKIKHLKSDVSLGQIPDLNLNDWIAEFHPTPALGVSPRNKDTLKAIKKFRSSFPKNFGAPFGFQYEDYFQAIVAIRGFFFDREKVYRPIGVGVTKSSSLVAEWKEISLKRFAMDELIGALMDRSGEVHGIA
ncbi:MAG: chorismate-binding protein [Bdellovibrionota bacterium]